MRLTQTEVGEMIGRTKSYISNIESGKKNLTNNNQMDLIMPLWGDINKFLEDFLDLFMEQGRNKQ